MSIKNLQTVFNEVRGTVVEINSSEDWSSIVLSVGIENKRLVNLVCKTKTFDEMINSANVNTDHYVSCRFYIVSRKTNDRYYTNANLLSIQKLSSLQV
jgi:hypothetical protein